METIKELAAGLSDHSNGYIRSLALSQPLRQPLLESALAWLSIPEKSPGLDLGCGIGLPAMLAADRLSLNVTGVDIKPECIKMARHLSKRACLDKSLNFVLGDGTALEFEDGCFDWAWSADCVRYDPVMGNTPLSEMQRVLKPGGTLALAAWSSQMLLPGYPGLEARLNATDRGTAPFQPVMEPDRHFFCTGHVLKKMGFQKIRVKSFLQDIRAPFSREMHRALLDLITMRWGRSPDKIPAGDRELYHSLTDPGSRNFILDDPEYYGFFTYTLFTGIKAGGSG